MKSDDFSIDRFSAGKDGATARPKAFTTQRLVVQHLANISKNLEAVNSELSNQLLEHVITPLANPI